jgi:hypothetical protein
MTSVMPALRSRVVGDLICQRDSYLQSLDTEVVTCVKLSAQDSNQSVTKVKSKATEGSRINGDASLSKSLWLIECADSVLFPEGTATYNSLPHLIFGLMISRRRPTGRLWYHHPPDRSLIQPDHNHFRSTAGTSMRFVLPQSLTTRDTRTSRGRFPASLGPHATTYRPAPALCNYG